MIDTHSHLQDRRFDEDRAQVIERAVAAGVTGMILPATEMASHADLMDVLERWPECCYGAMGVHPTTINDNPDYARELEAVARELHDSPGRWVAVGEVGLDLYWSRDFLEQQIVALRYQLELAVEYDLPVLLHVRDAWGEIFDVLEPYRGRIRGVFHSFSGTIENYNAVVALGGFLVGISGPITYKKSALVDVVREIPLERILLETDAPYLPPVPHRGQRNESSYVPLVAQMIAQIKGVEVAVVDAVTTASAMRMFFDKKA